MTSVTLQDDWGLDLVGVVCNQCGWNYLTTDSSTRLCPHCSEGKLEPFEVDEDHLTTIEPPELVVQYRVGREQMGRIIAQFADEIPYPPIDLNPMTVSQRIERVYLPMWLADATVRAQWEAQVGYNYQVESHKSSFRGGQWYTKKVHETRVEWEERAGQLQREYENVSAPALDEHPQLMRALGRYNVEDAQAYQQSAVQKALVRLPNRSTEDAFTEAKEQFKARAADDVKQATEAEGIREFKWRAGYQNLHWTQLLLPVYMSYYQDDEGTHRVIYINGVTGESSGVKRGSMQRARLRTVIGLGITAALVSVAVALVLVNPEMDDYAATTAIIALLIGIGSLFPVIQVWRFNQRQE